MKIRYIVILILGGILYTIGLLGLARVISTNPARGEELFGSVITNMVVDIGDIPGNIRSYFSKPNFFIADSLNGDGFTYFSDNISTYSKLLVSYKTDSFDSKIQLLDIKTGALIKEWTPNSKQITALSFNEDNPMSFEKGSDLHYSYPLLLKDSSVVFNTNYSLVKINKNSEVEWVNNAINAHHSIEMDAGGDIYISARNFLAGNYDFLPSNSEAYQKSLHDEAIMKIDASTGEILYDKSIIEILVENGYESLMYAGGHLLSDPIHLNDVQPALRKGRFWDQGDLLISCRNLSLVFLYRPSTNSVLWKQQGPWKGQHDANFHGDKWVTVFGNDVIVDSPSGKIFQKGHHLLRGFNEIYKYDLEKDSLTTPFTNLMQKENIKTPSRGKGTLLPNGDIFIEETDNGRIIFGDSIKKKILFVRRIDSDHISSLNWSRIID